MKKVYSQEMTKEKLEIIRKFMEQFRNQDVIVADQFSQTFDLIPFEDERISIISDANLLLTAMTFQRKINHNNEPYVVSFQLKNSDREDGSSELNSFQVDITGNGTNHFNRFVDEDLLQYGLLDEMVEVFGDKDIKSPSIEYGGRIISNSKLQELIKNHEWGLIAEGIEQLPILAYALFLEDKNYEASSGCYEYSLINEKNFFTSFGTILYHLIKFRNNNIGMMSEKELKELDALILKLSDSDLLKVELTNLVVTDSYLPPNDELILLDTLESARKTTASRQYNTANNGLNSEEKVLQMIKTQSR